MHPTSSLLISTYNWPQALELILSSVLLQELLPDEILIADDGSKVETKELIDSFRSKFSIPIKHFWQEDKGFRKTLILNEALRNASGDYIIQIDGDIILHPSFIKDHLENCSPGYFIKGSRGRLTEKKSKQIFKTKNIHIHSLMSGVKSRINSTRCTLLSPFFHGDPYRTNDLRGCNFAFWKKDFMAVNGYNNDLLSWGHEDIELAARLVNFGVKRKQLKMTAVCFHIHHPLESKSRENYNYSVYEEVAKNKIIRCKNGIEQDK